MTGVQTCALPSGELTWPLAYKWKISWNESAKNVAFWNQYPEFNHNEFIGWSSHPVEKPFAIIDLRSSLERQRIRERMELSDRLLSGKRPKATVVELKGETLMQQLLWGLTLGGREHVVPHGMARARVEEVGVAHAVDDLVALVGAGGDDRRVPHRQGQERPAPVRQGVADADIPWAATQIGRASVGKECRSRWSRYH